MNWKVGLLAIVLLALGIGAYLEVEAMKENMGKITVPKNAVGTNSSIRALANGTGGTAGNLTGNSTINYNTIDYSDYWICTGTGAVWELGGMVNPGNRITGYYNDSKNEYYINCTVS